MHYPRAGTCAGALIVCLLILLSACDSGSNPTPGIPIVPEPPIATVDAAVTTPAAPSERIQAFNARYNAEGTNPEVVAHLWFEGMFRYLDPATHRDGITMLETILESENWLSDPELKIYRENLERRPYLFYSYDAAASPGNGYLIDTYHFELRFVGSTKIDDQRHRLEIKSNGTDTGRYVILAKNNQTGLWQTREFSTIYNGIQPPPGDPPRSVN